MVRLIRFCTFALALCPLLACAQEKRAEIPAMPRADATLLRAYQADLAQAERTERSSEQRRMAISHLLNLYFHPSRFISYAEMELGMQRPGEPPATEAEGHAAHTPEQAQAWVRAMEKNQKEIQEVTTNLLEVVDALLGPLVIDKGVAELRASYAERLQSASARDLRGIFSEYLAKIFEQARKDKQFENKLKAAGAAYTQYVQLFRRVVISHREDAEPGELFPVARFRSASFRLPPEDGCILMRDPTGKYDFLSQANATTGTRATANSQIRIVAARFNDTTLPVKNGTDVQYTVVAGINHLSLVIAVADPHARITLLEICRNGQTRNMDTFDNDPNDPVVGYSIWGA